MVRIAVAAAAVIARHAPVAINASGQFLIAWTRIDDRNGPREIYARRYNADGAPLNNPYRISDTTSGYNYEPRIDAA